MMNCDRGHTSLSKLVDSTCNNRNNLNMALIEISNLNPAGSDLLAGTESFLTELQENDSRKIFGGGKKGHGKKGRGKRGCGGYGGHGGGCGGGGSSSGGSSGGGGCYGGGKSS
jgi:hypothetical protein